MNGRKPAFLIKLNDNDDPIKNIVRVKHDLAMITIYFENEFKPGT